MSIEAIRKALAKKLPGADIDVTLDGRGIATLRGSCASWDAVVDAGHLAAKQPGVANVVNKLTVNGTPAPQKNYAPALAAGLAAGQVADVDVLIVGAGVVGCGIARELAKYQLNILVAEMTDDVATGATKANNGNIHAGHAAKPGTLKARLNVEGNRMYTAWAEALGFELQRSGAMGFITNPLLWPALLVAYGTAVKNGVDGVRLVSGAEARCLEPGFERGGLGPKVKGALWLPSMGLVEPYQVTVALAENAAANGVRFWFNCTVADVLHENGRVLGAVTSRGVVKARYVINCAGVHADELSAMAGDECYTIHPRRGVIAILDKAARPEYESLAEHIDLAEVVRTLKKSNSKGGGMCRTPEYNTLMGPSALEVPDKEDLSTTAEELAYAMGRGDAGINYGNIIRYFAGNRPADYSEDFVIGMSALTHGLINVGAIQSPGLAAAPAIAKMVEEILAGDAAQDGAPLCRRENWQPRRMAPPAFRRLSRVQQDALIQKDPAYARVICRCEQITEGELLAAMRSPLPPCSIDALKRRCRAGMGRCQGGFCQPRVLELLARAHGLARTDVTLRGAGTGILLRCNRPGGAFD